MTFYPDRYARTYHAWHANIRDWCISRQLWWGHQIPVWVRVVSAADAPPEVDGARIDTAVSVQSQWVEAGASHLARRITDDEVEEAVCVPPDGTLRRLDRDDSSMDEAALIAALEAGGFARDPDVLDTWFSSGLWPMSTMGWPWPEDYPETVGLMDTFNPTSVLTTAREIITLWVSRMTMFNRYFLDGQLAFDDVFIHAMIQDGHGQKMSKSLGNGVDPRDIIHSHGADAMRFTLVQMTTDTQDVRMPVDMICPHTGQAFTPEFVTTSAGHTVAAAIQESPAGDGRQMVSAYGVAVGTTDPTDDRPLARNTSAKFDHGRNFTNKIWNATRFALRRLDGASPHADPVDLSEALFADRWIIARLEETLKTLDSAISRYQFNVFADTLYDFVWHDVCDRYLEAIKPTVNDNPTQQVVLGTVLDSVLRIMHPVCPFVTETLWPHVSAARCGEITGVHLPPSPLLTTASWPTVDDAVTDEHVTGRFDRANQLVRLIRALRSERTVKPKQMLTLHVTDNVAALIASTDGLVETLAGVGHVVSLDEGRPLVASPLAFEGAEVLISGLVDTADVEAEQRRLTQIVNLKTKQITGFTGKLANEGYLNNAKPELVAETRELLVAAQADLAAAEAALAALGD